MDIRNSLILLLLVTGVGLNAQRDSIPEQRIKDSTFIKKRMEMQGKREAAEPIEITIEDYKIITHSRDTTYLDTTLTIQKEYKYNYLRRDDFELMPFANIAQAYNSLGVTFDQEPYYPHIGARAKHEGYLETEDILYYNVATPMSDLFFKTTFEQGQMLDATLTFNTSRRLNFSIAYKGFRSLGKYRFSQTQSGTFRTTFNYVTANGKYSIRAHFAGQDLESEENGGLLAPEFQFESDDPQFTDRSRIDVNFENAGNRILGKRYFLDHYFGLLSGEGKKPGLLLGHQAYYETRSYRFRQDTQTDFFGPAFLTPVDDKARLKHALNQLSLTWNNKLLGNLKAFAELYRYDYFFNSILVTPEGTIPNRLEGEELSIGATYKRSIGKFSLEGDGQYTITGSLSDFALNAHASIVLKEKHKVSASLHTASRMPNFNFLLFQSEYENYNWDNSESFDKQQVYQLKFDLSSQVWGDLSASYTTIDNYTYFRSGATQEQFDSGTENAYVKPEQAGQAIDHLRVKYSREFRWRKWALMNTILYQEVSQDENVLNVPQLLTRNSLYFSSDVFKKAMYVQTGITVKYFTEYSMNAYNPLLGEFFVQDRESFGGFPLLDFFINAKVQKTRIYFKAEHFNSSFSNNMYYSAPDYPYRDFVIRFGLIWNFFS